MLFIIKVKEDDTRDTSGLNNSKTINDVFCKKTKPDRSFLIKVSIGFKRYWYGNKLIIMFIYFENLKDKRFKNEGSFDTPGPGRYYNLNRDQVKWNKKSFNILYEV